MAKTTINDKLLDDTIRHAVYLERIKTGQSRRIIEFLEKEVFPDLIAKLRRRIERIRGRGYDTGPATTRQIRNAVTAFYKQLQDGLNDALALLKTDMKTLATVEVQQVLKSLKKQMDPLKGVLPVTFEEVSIRTAQAVFSDALVEGEFISKWFSEMALKTRNDVLRQMRIGIAEGETAQQITRRISGTKAAGFKDGILGQTRRNIQTNVRTAIASVSNRARQLAYKANDDLVKEWRYTATLDGKTSDICISLDGQTFPVDEGPQPPQHFNCRSTTTPVLSSWKEFGKKAGVDFQDIPPGTRASMSGQVPADLSYGEWLKGQTKGFQESVLGIRRTELFRAGELDVTQFVDRTGRSLTIEELERL